VLDYWGKLGTKPCFDLNHQPAVTPHTLDFLRALVQSRGTRFVEEELPHFLTGEHWQVLKNYPVREMWGGGGGG
jgi:hypothetical protein